MRDAHRPVANDDPFEINDRVGIVRARHGWHDGEIEGTVTERWQSPQGTWKYRVTDDDGNDYEIAHTRDLVERRSPGLRR